MQEIKFYWRILYDSQGGIPSSWALCRKSLEVDREPDCEFELIEGEGYVVVGMVRVNCEVYGDTERILVEELDTGGGGGCQGALVRYGTCCGTRDGCMSPFVGYV